MQELYKQLIDLTTVNESFFFKDFPIDDRIYRIFNYRLASYTEFLIPGAVECRGIMFLVDDDGKYLDIKSRPMEKFWNIDENPATMGLDLTDVIRVMDKADGSLISSYNHDTEIRLKSKGSLSSDQAIDAMKYLEEPENKDLKLLIEFVNGFNYTVNLEWCSPDNRIVLAYDKPHLQILNVRHNYRGEYLDFKSIEHSVLIHFQHVIDKYAVKEIEVEDPAEFISRVPNMKEKIEGFVCEMKNGQFFKIKTLAYLALHHSKDSINSPRRLYEAVLEEATDDLRSLFHDDPLSIKLIEDMEDFVEVELNKVVHSVEVAYNEYKDLDRKNFAISCQKDLPKIIFSLAMNLYLGKEFSYKDFMKKRWKEFGIKDIEKEL